LAGTAGRGVFLRETARGIPTAENATATHSADLNPATNVSGEL
jgi:hypothetical protein